MSRFYLGMDVGGTNVRIALYDEAKNLISSVQKVGFKRSGNPKVEVDSNLCELIEAFIRKNELNNENLKGIGLSLAALFDRGTGDITIWPNNKIWNGFPLGKYLTERFKVPVLMEDDANSAALGEHLTGAGRGICNLAYITISTGIGCGLILNNNLFTGSNGWAGEIGHIKVIQDGPECTCGMKGCLQSLASGPAIYNKFNQIKGNKNCCPDKALDLKDIANMAYEGDAAAREAFVQAGVYIGNVIANTVMLLDISLVILGGGVTCAGDILLKAIRDTVNDSLGKFKRDIYIKNAQLGDDCGVIGALGLIYKHINENKLLPV